MSENEVIDVAITEMQTLLTWIEQTNESIVQKRKQGEQYNQQIQLLQSIKVPFG